MKKVIGSAFTILVFASQVSMGQTAVKSHTATNPASALTVKTIQLPGVKLQYVETGRQGGTPVIFLHGLSDSWHSYEQVLPLLPQDIHAFAITQRGHGDSEKPAGNYRIKDFANDVAGFIKQKNLGQVILVGHSMGGLVVQQVMVSYPALVKKLVIIDSDASFKDNPGMPEFHAAVKEMKGAIDEKFMNEFQSGTLVKPIDSAYYRLLVAEGMKTPLHVFQAALNGIMETNLREDLKKIKIPVLIFFGEKDNFCLRSGQDVMAKNLVNSTLKIYENTGHALHWEEPVRFVADLVEFARAK